MGRWKKRNRWGMPKGEREPMMARVAIILLLANGFLWAAFHYKDFLMISMFSVVLALGGLVAGRLALRKIHRYGGRLRGENMATIGYWGNILVFLLVLVLFAYFLASAIYNEEIL